MSTTSAIQAAIVAGHTTPETVYQWLAGPTGETVNSGVRLGLTDIAEAIGAEAAGTAWAAIKAAAASSPTLDLVVDVLRDGQFEPGALSAQTVLASLVSAGILTSQQASGLTAIGQRAQIRAELYGLSAAPTPHEIKEHL